MDNRTNIQIAAQIAVEAIINNREDYTEHAIMAVKEFGKANGVSDFYTNMI